MRSIYFAAVIFILFTTGCVREKMEPAKTESRDTVINSDVDHSEMGHDKMMMENGEKEMGFSQTNTTHHFLMKDDGGAIKVEVKDPLNTEDLEKIRGHLKMISVQFQKGIFNTPFAVHGQMPPGAAVMDQLKEEISYTYEETDKGALVRITTKNPDALAAIKSFLKFQIEEHKTGDPLK